MIKKETNYIDEYTELQEKLIPDMSKNIRDYNNLLEMAYGYRLSNPLPNIQIQYNNSSIYVDWEFRKAGVDPSENLVRNAIRSDMQEIVYKGTNALTNSAEIIMETGSERDTLEYIKEYNDADMQLWKYDYKKDIVDHIMIYCLETYHSAKKQCEDEDKASNSLRKKYTVDDILTPDMLEEILDTLKKLGFSERTLLETEEKWHEVLLDVLRTKEKEREAKIEQKGVRLQREDMNR